MSQALRECGRAIDARLNEHIRRIEMRLDMRADGTKRIEAFGAGELDVTFLKVARSDVVEARVAEEIGQGIIGIAELRTAAADNEGALALVLDAPGIGGWDDHRGRS